MAEPRKSQQKVTDAPDVTGAPEGPSLDDLVDVIATTNRGIRNLQHDVETLKRDAGDLYALVLATFVFTVMMILVKARP